MIDEILQHVGAIDDFFERKMCIVGGFVDHIEIAEPALKDLDLVVDRAVFNAKFNLVRGAENTPCIIQDGFKLARVDSSLFSKNICFFQGNYNNLPLDIFVPKFLHATYIDDVMLTVDKGLLAASPTTTIGGREIKISDAPRRVISLRQMLNQHIPESSRAKTILWYKRKKITCRRKLDLYYAKYPELREIQPGA